MEITPCQFPQKTISFGNWHIYMTSSSLTDYSSQNRNKFWSADYLRNLAYLYSIKHHCEQSANQIYKATSVFSHMGFLSGSFKLQACFACYGILFNELFIKEKKTKIKCINNLHKEILNFTFKHVKLPSLYTQMQHYIKQRKWSVPLIDHNIK